MTLKHLQDALVEEMTTLFRGETFFAPGTTDAPMHVFKQQTPTPQVEDDTAGMIPLVEVKMAGGTGNTAKVLLVFCTYDPDPERDGTDVTLHCITKVLNRFSENAYVGNFECSGMEWTVQDGKDYPFYFGFMELTFNIPQPVRKDAFC